MRKEDDKVKFYKNKVQLLCLKDARSFLELVLPFSVAPIIHF